MHLLMCLSAFRYAFTDVSVTFDLERMNKFKGPQTIGWSIASISGEPITQYGR